MAKRKRTRKWYQEAKTRHYGWRKEHKQETRIRKLLEAHPGPKCKKILASARAINALANVTRDPETRRKARADAKLLFARYRRECANKRR